MNFKILSFSQIKFSAAKGKNLDILTEVEIIDGYDVLRKDLKKVSVGFYFCNIVLH